MIDRRKLVLIGHPVAHSLSPVMQNAALEAAGLSVRYEILDVVPELLGDALSTLRSENAAGNFTIPHKMRALKSMQKLTGMASHAGAVNTFWVDADGELAGDNTDVAGFNGLAKDVIGSIPENARVAVLGAGGAASAVVTALEGWTGASASVHARDLSRAVAMRMRHSVVVRACSMRDPCLDEANIVVNTTPLGLTADDAMPVEMERLSADAILLDLVYARGETAWVRRARSEGHLAADGLRMLLHQGVAAFERWFGQEPDATVMWQALAAATGRSASDTVG